MRAYATSRFRIVFLSVVAVFLASGAAMSYAQEATGTAEKAAQPGLFSLIMNNLDGVFVVIGVLSVVGVGLIIQGFIRARRTVLMPDATVNHMRELISQRQFKELMDFTETDPSFVARALNPALKRAPSFSSMKEAMETAVGEQTANEFRKIEFLNIIGNLGPLLGLLGTTLGMIDAFGAVQAAGGSANVGELSGGISKALAHTFLGLVLAVPCLAAFGVLRTLVDRLTVQAALVAEELLLMIKPAEAKPAAVARSAAAVAPKPGAPVAAPAPVVSAIPRKPPVSVPPPSPQA